MCGRLSLFADGSTLRDAFDVDVSVSLRPRYNLAPGQRVAVVRDDDAGAVRRATWGFDPDWTDGAGRLINARAETLHDRRAFRTAAAERRCLVIADGFYEWDRDPTDPQPYRFARPEDRPFALAGLWRRPGAGEPATVAVVTTAAAGVVEPVHDRTPVLFRPGEGRRWLRADDREERESLLGPPDVALRPTPVSRAVNDTSNDDPSLLDPVAPDRQAGLDEFAP